MDYLDAATDTLIRYGHELTSREYIVFRAWLDDFSPLLCGVALSETCLGWVVCDYIAEALDGRSHCSNHPHPSIVILAVRRLLTEEQQKSTRNLLKGLLTKIINSTRKRHNLQPRRYDWFREQVERKYDEDRLGEDRTDTCGEEACIRVVAAGGS